MSIKPNTIEVLARARNDLRIGLPIVIGDIIVVASETLTESRLSFLQKIGSLSLVITKWRAKTLKLGFYDNDIVRLVLPLNVTSSWVRAVADPSQDLANPLKGPLKSIRDKNSKEARSAINLVKKTQLLPSVVLGRLKCGEAYAKVNNLTYINPKKLEFAQSKASELNPIISAKIPILASMKSKITIFRPGDGTSEHYVIEVGKTLRKMPVLTRLHSACFTGDVLGSLKCDCGPQLNSALEQISKNGSGLLLYLNQEGRGIGLANKMRAYSLQDEGFDTVDANHRLGFEDDERDYKIGAEILKRLGFSEVNLLTNNPHKVSMLEENGIRVAIRLPLRIGKTDLNKQYLETKEKKSGHIFD